MSQDKPIIIELAGLPATGKSTTSNLLKNTFVHQGLNCKIIPTALTSSPLAQSKTEWIFDAWHICKTIMFLLEESLHSKNDFIIIERGLVDSLCWLEWFRLNYQIEHSLIQRIEDFATIPEWFKQTNLTIVLLADFKTALQRRGKISRIINPNTYQQLRTAYEIKINSFHANQNFKNIHVYETDNISPNQIHNLIIEKIKVLDINSDPE